jgi:hypothetical protein
MRGMCVVSHCNYNINHSCVCVCVCVCVFVCAMFLVTLCLWCKCVLVMFFLLMGLFVWPDAGHSMCLTQTFVVYIDALIVYAYGTRNDRRALLCWFACLSLWVCVGVCLPCHVS